MKFTGWDCAIKSLAYSYVDINLDILINLRSNVIKYPSCEHINSLLELLAETKKILETFIVPISIGVVDLLNGRLVKDVSFNVRTKLLKKFLESKSDFVNSQHIIEQQPSYNNKTVFISSQLAFYYAETDPILVNAKLKCRISLINKVNSNLKTYNGRKSHCKSNFLYLMNVFKLNDSIKAVPKLRLADAADSFMQIIAYILDKKMLKI